MFMEKSYLPRFIAQWIEEKKVYIEIVLLSVFILTVLSYQYDLLNDFTLMMSFLTISGFYFLLAYLPTDETENAFKKICIKVTGIASSVTVVGTLFVALEFEGGLNMLVIGLLSLVPCIVYLAYSLFFTSSSYSVI